MINLVSGDIMPKVKGPFFSTWASGSLGKKITVRAFGDNKFVIQKYKSRSGKRHEIQDLNAQVFANRQKGGWKGYRELTEE